jgi:hypothetical protein
MTTLNDVRCREARRLSVMSALKLAGQVGLALDEKYAARAELGSMIQEGLVIASPGREPRYYLTPRGEKLRRKLVKHG